MTPASSSPGRRRPRVPPNVLRRVKMASFVFEEVTNIAWYTIPPPFATVFLETKAPWAKFASTIMGLGATDMVFCRAVSQTLFFSPQARPIAKQIDAPTKKVPPVVNWIVSKVSPFPVPPKTDARLVLPKKVPPRLVLSSASRARTGHSVSGLTAFYKTVLAHYRMEDHNLPSDETYTQAMARQYDELAKVRKDLLDANDLQMRLCFARLSAQIKSSDVLSRRRR